MSKENGTHLLIYIDVSGTPTPIAGATDNNLTIDGAVIDVTSKDSGVFKEKLAAGKLDWKMDGTGFFDNAPGSGAVGYDDIFNIMIAQQAVTVRFSSQVSGEIYYEGSGYFTSLAKGAPLEAGATFKYTIEGNGTLTQQAS